MDERIKLYMDEHVPAAATDALRRRGVDVLTVGDVGMLAADDSQHLEWAMAEGRVVFTQDADFLRLHAQGVQHAGIVYAAQQTPVRDIIRGLLLITDVLSPQDMRNHVEFI